MIGKLLQLSSRCIVVCTLTFIIANTAYAQTNPGPTVGSTGSVPFTYMSNNVTYATIRAADGNVWLRQNLGSTQVATATTDVNAYGDLFQWGRWDDGHQSRTSSSTAALILLGFNNPAGLNGGSPLFYRGTPLPHWWGTSPATTDTWNDTAISAANGKDPCAALGAGWHVPTQSEWAAVITAESITDVNSAFGSNLKLPATGNRPSNGSALSNVGVQGYYWTNNTVSSTAANATAVTFDATSVNTSGSYLRGFGMSVRCMLAPCLDTKDSTATEICSGASYTLPKGTIVYAPGRYVDTFISVKGCDSMIIVNLTVKTIDTSVVQTGNTLTANATGVLYQWIDCNTASAINGANNQSFTPAVPGSYAVGLYSIPCIATSQCYDINTVGLKEIVVPQIKIYPNPASQVINIQFPGAVSIFICDVSGKVVLSTNSKQIDVSKLSRGLYFIKVTNQENVSVTIEKLFIVADGNH